MIAPGQRLDKEPVRVPLRLRNRVDEPELIGRIPLDMALRRDLDGLSKYRLGACR